MRSTSSPSRSATSGPTGGVVWVSVSASCVRDGAGLPLYLIGQIADITERREMSERLAHAALHDSLTALPNRDLFIDRLEMALRRARRGGRLVAVMFIDLDDFKLVNDSLGHEVGDRVLRAVADRMGGALRTSDTLARFGGDEFTVLCEEVTGEAHALEIAERLQEAMRRPLMVTGGATHVSFSVGIALSGDEAEGGATLLRQADTAMYRAKAGGPARVEVYAEEDDPLTGSRLRTATDVEGRHRTPGTGAPLPTLRGSPHPHPGRPGGPGPLAPSLPRPSPPP